MSELLGPITIPEPTTSGTFPVQPDYGMVEVSQPQVVAHRFGHGDAAAEQRFNLGPGTRNFTLTFDSLSADRRNSIYQFFEAHLGSYHPFTLTVTQMDGTTISYTARFANPNLSLEQFSAALWRGTMELVEVPTTTPAHTVATTLQRFPSSTLKTALLDPVQEIIPLVKIGSDIYLSDRRVQVDGTLYQPRLLDWGGISQGLDGQSDLATLTLGNADRVLTDLVNAVDLYKAPLEFSLFHVGSGIKLDLWKGTITKWTFDAGPEFKLEASDGLHELHLGYPTRRISRQDGFDIPQQPVPTDPLQALLTRMSSRSITNETAYGKILKDIYINAPSAPMPVPCDIMAIRDESEFLAALGVVGRGPISSFYTGTDKPSTLDGQPHHGPGTLGLFQSSGGNPATGSTISTDPFWLNAIGQTPPAKYIDGCAFQFIRRTDEKGIQAIAAAQHAMIAQVTGGLGCWKWTAPGSRSWQPACTNPIWIAVDLLLTVKGVHEASAAAQETLFDVDSAVAVAAICDTTVDQVIGAGTETQFTFTGRIEEEKALRDWIREILGTCLGYSTFAFGKLKFGCRVNSSTVEAFTVANILYNSLALSGLQPEFNRLVTSFGDVEFEYQQNTVSLSDLDHVGRVGETTPGNVNLVGVSRKSHAARLVTVRLREEVGGLGTSEQLAARQVSFATTVLALNTEPGMVCSLTHPDMPGGAGEFRVTSWRLNRDYSIEIQGKTTTDSMYDLAIGPKPTDTDPDAIPERNYRGLVPDDPTIVSVTPSVVQDSNGVKAIALDIVYDAPDPLGTFTGVGVRVDRPDGTKSDLRFFLYAPAEGVTTDTCRVICPPPEATENWTVWVTPTSNFIRKPITDTTPNEVVEVDPVAPITVDDIVLPPVTNPRKILIEPVGTSVNDNINAKITLAYDAPVDMGEGDLLFSGVVAYLETPDGITEVGWLPYNGTAGGLGAVVFQIPYPSAAASWTVYFVSRSPKYIAKLKLKTDASPSPHVTFDMVPDPFGGAAPDVPIFRGGISVGDGTFTASMRWDAIKQQMLIDWAATPPVNAIWRRVGPPREIGYPVDTLNWSGVEVWIGIPIGGGEYNYVQATGTILKDAFRESEGGLFFYYDTISVGLETIPDPVQEWKFIAASRNRYGRLNVDEDDNPTGPAFYLGTLPKSDYVSGFSATVVREYSESGDQTFRLTGAWTNPAVSRSMGVRIVLRGFSDGDQVLAEELDGSASFYTDAWPIPEGSKSLTIYAVPTVAS